MKNKLIASSIAVLLATTSLISCKKDSTSSASLTPQVSFALSTDNAITTFAVSPGSNGLTVSAVSTGAASVKWTAGTANIARFKLEAKKGNTKIEITSKNLSNVDLFSISPSLISSTIDTGTYKEIEIRAELEKSTSTTLPLILKGSFTTASGLVVPIEFDYNDNATIKAEADNVVVDGKTDLTTILNMHLNKLLAGVTAADIDATTRTSGTILISGTINASLYNKIKVNIESACSSKGFEHHDKSERKNHQ
jgi:hypothetical protein